MNRAPNDLNEAAAVASVWEGVCWGQSAPGESLRWQFKVFEDSEYKVVKVFAVGAKHTTMGDKNLLVHGSSFLALTFFGYVMHNLGLTICYYIRGVG